MCNDCLVSIYISVLKVLYVIFHDHMVIVRYSKS